MKAYVRCGTLALLCAFACNRPDNDLFGPDSPASDPSAGGSSNPVAAGATSTGATGSGADTNADMVKGGSGSGSSASIGGSAPTAGTEPADGGGNGGSASSTDTGGSAGNTTIPDGEAGSGDPPVQPPEPVCGNGKLEMGEQCDDAGHTGDDGCDANCKVVCSQFGAGTLESDDHHCYNGYDETDFASAQQECVKKGAHLATISSAAENAIARMFVHDGKWIGGSEDVPLTSPGKGDYEWLTGEPFTYTNWGPKEPNQAPTRCGGNGGPSNQSCYEHCIAIIGDGTWADHRCDTVDGYVCEWEPAGSK